MQTCRNNALEQRKQALAEQELLYAQLAEEQRKADEAVRLHYEQHGPFAIAAKGNAARAHRTLPELDRERPVIASSASLTTSRAIGALTPSTPAEHNAAGLARLRTEIVQLARAAEPTSAELETQRATIIRLDHAVRRLWGDARVLVGGSRFPGHFCLFLPSSDLDIVVAGAPRVADDRSLLVALQQVCVSARLIERAAIRPKTATAPAILAAELCGRADGTDFVAMPSLDVRLEHESAAEYGAAHLQRGHALVALIECTDWKVVRELTLAIKVLVRDHDAREDRHYDLERRCDLTGYPTLLLAIAFVHVRASLRRPDIARA